MTNRLRTPIDEGETGKRLVVEEKSIRDFPDNDLIRFFKNIFNADRATKALPFILFFALLGMIYIGNSHLAEKNIRDIDKISKEVKELNYDYKTTKAELAFKSTLTEVARRVDTLGIKESVLPPQKLTTEGVQDEH